MAVISKNIIDNNDSLKFKGEKYINTLNKILKHLDIYDENAINSFLKPSLKDFNDPSLLEDMDVAISLLTKTINKKGRIVLFSDYDADGVTSVALFVKVLRHINYNNFDYFIPDRHLDGYGVSEKNLKIASSDADLIITADTGIREINSLLTTDVPIIVTDHHDPIVSYDNDIAEQHPNGKLVEEKKQYMVIPDVDAVINPRRIDCKYPNKCLAGVGVLYKLFQALFKELEIPVTELIPYLDVVAVGTVADLVPQVDSEHQNTENRLITALGLQMMNQDPDTWTNSFKIVHRLNKIEFNNLGFSIGPNLNAASRMGSAHPAVEFLIEEDPDSSIDLCKALNDINTLRKKTQKDATESSTTTHSTDNIIVTILDEEFNSGVAGLVASQLSDMNNSPAIVFCVKEEDGVEMLTGSCRSIDGVSIIDALTKTEKKIGKYKYGGHKQAAGLTIKKSQFDDFYESVRDLMDAIDMESLRGKLSYDLDLPLNELDHEVVSLLNSSYINLRLLSDGNVMYSPPSPHKNPLWSRLYLDKLGERYQAMLWNNSEKVINEYIQGNIKSIDIVYQASFYNGDISISVNNYLINS